MANTTTHEVMATLKGIPKEIIAVTWIETGVERRMYRAAFDDLFGGAEGREILAGNLPHIVAVKE